MSRLWICVSGFESLPPSHDSLCHSEANCASRPVAISQPEDGAKELHLGAEKAVVALAQTRRQGFSSLDQLPTIVAFTAEFLISHPHLAEWQVSAP